jgi:hypothetical protein
MNRHYESPLDLMAAQGGNFIRGLALCYRAADPVNKAKLRETFAGYFDVYEQRFEQWLQQYKEAA